ncbi:MAG: tetratricopeptide repeat protein [Treponema sp.]|uniref:tetratricopeptide repeat protein n=1 Tax=Treponema sp. TaxID=166 RepID=UPI00298DC705|nr:tetratricopeptide repeat protein [Treponema sp.]MBR5932801.1 tetratricopeptide repeat protein [Treponema sp.]
MKFFIFFYLLQLLLLIHIIKTRRDFTWIYLLIFLPYVSALAYIILCIIPDIMHSRVLYKAQGTVADIIIPNRKIKELEKAVRISDTPANILNLADAYAQSGRFSEAVELYKKIMTGVYKNDSEIEYKLMISLYELGEFAEAKKILKSYKKHVELTTRHQQLMEMLINQDYQKLSDKFFSDVDFEIGYNLARCYAKEGKTEQVKTILSEMKEARNNFVSYRKGTNKTFYNLTKRLV